MDDTLDKGTDIKTVLDTLESDIFAELEQIALDLDRAWGLVEEQVARIGTELEKSRKALKPLCQQAAQASETEAPVHLESLVGEIDRQKNWLCRKLRPELNQALAPFSPRNQPVVTAMGRIERRYAEVVGCLPGHSCPSAGETSWFKKSSIRLRLTMAVPFRLAPETQVQALLAGRAEPEKAPLSLDYQGISRAYQSKLADVWRGLRFHFESVVDDLKKVYSPGEKDGKNVPIAAQVVETEKLLMSVIDGAEGAIASALVPLGDFVKRLPDDLSTEQRELLLLLHRELDHVPSVKQIFSYSGRRMARTFSQLKEKVVRMAAFGPRLFASSAGNGMAQTGSLLRNLQGVLDKSGKTEETLLSLTDLPSQAQVSSRASDQAPHYARIFSMGPLTCREFLVGRDAEFETLLGLVERWREGKACSIAVVGPEGSGKTSLVNCFASQHENQDEVLRTKIRSRLVSERGLLDFFQEWFGLDTPFSSVDEVAACIKAGPRRILIVGEGHNIALRAIGGYAAARGFFHIMMATRFHCLWLVTFRKYPWVLLDYQVGGGQFFTHQISTLFHDKTELREAILLRHRISALPLEFLEPGGDKGEGQAEGQGEEQARQAALGDLYFSTLFDASSGNIDAAIYFWLLSTRVDLKSGVVKVTPLGKPDYGFLRKFEREKLFALAEIVNHGGLSVEEYCRIFRKPQLEGRMSLDTLDHLNLLVAQAEGEQGRGLRYGINPIFFGPVTRILESMNILY